MVSDTLQVLRCRFSTPAVDNLQRSDLQRV
jgi:hypothetical protein